jgi:threonine/homoserine/homoserine lactone efflux protein
MPFYILKGLVIGFSIAAPVGPIGLLCIRRSMAEGQRVGLVTGLGAATADAGYGCVAAFGLTGVSGFLVGHRIWLSLIGGLFLCYLGVRTFISNPAARAANVQAGGLLPAYLSTLFLTITMAAKRCRMAHDFAPSG